MTMKHSGKIGNNNLIIRNANPEELDEVKLLLKTSYLEYENSFPPESWKSYLDNIVDIRSRLGISELIVAELNGLIVGAVTLYMDASQSIHEEWPKGWAGIRLLAVHPEYRDKGIGRALMEECISRCRAQDIKTIGIHTAEIMSVAYKMYESMNFVRTPEYDFHPNSETVVMAYRLQL